MVGVILIMDVNVTMIMGTNNNNIDSQRNKAEVIHIMDVNAIMIMEKRVDFKDNGTLLPTTHQKCVSLF